MDPITALAAASAIAGFVQMGVSLVLKASDIYSSASGMSKENEQIEFVIKELSKVSDSVALKKPASQQTEEEKGLTLVAEKCQQLSDKILQILNRTKVKGHASKYDSAVAALKDMWNKKEKKALKKDADECRDLLHLQLTLLMKFVQATSKRERFLLTWVFAIGQRRLSGSKSLAR